MIKPRRKILLMLVGLLITCCSDSTENDSSPRPYYRAQFQAAPVNFEEVNTQYDDYNSAPPISDDFPLFFSSNRNSQGNDFDIVKEQISITFFNHDGKLIIRRGDVEIHDFACLDDALSIINTQSNQFGPYITPAADLFAGQDCADFFFFYADDATGNLDIRFSYHVDDAIGFTESYAADLLNSEFDDAYPTFNEGWDEIYFTSNRNTSFDIYKVDIPNGTDLIERLKDVSLSSNCTRVDVLSSDKNDKCPIIVGDLLVFASDRDGGYGGYDLWYATYEDGSWGAPKNFGAQINSEFDEFRPVVRDVQDFNNNLMIFSSNRPGGRGGFDLYYVGIPLVPPN